MAYGGAGIASPRDAAQLAHPRPRRRRARPGARGRGVRSGGRRGRGVRGSGDAPGGAAAPGDHLVPVPVRSLSSAGESVREAAVGPRMARDQWPRRLRRRGRCRACRRDAITDCSIAALPDAARPHDDAEPSLRAAPAAGRHALRDRRPGAGGQRARVAGRRAPRRVPPRARPARLAVRARRHQSSRSACTCSISRTPCTSRIASSQAAAPSGSSCVPALHFRPLEAIGRTGRSTSPTRSPPSRIASSCPRTRGYPPLRLKVYGRRATFALDSGKLDNVHYRVEAQRGYDRRRRAVEPGVLQRRT